MKRFLLIFFALLFLSACTPGSTGTPTQNWSIVKLLTQEEQVESITDVRVVRHCGPILEQKSISCVAGTSKELSFSMGGSGGFSLGVEVTVDSSVGNALGLNRESGEQLDLPTPPDGSIYRYIVTTEYRVLHGQALAKSNAGEERTADYAFQATCTLRIEDVEQQSCQENVAGNPSGGEGTPEAQQTAEADLASQVEALLEQANQQYQAGQYGEAIDTYTQVLALDPANAIAYNQRGNAYRQLAQYEMCLNDYTQAIQNATSQAEAATYYANRGAVYALQNAWQRALDDFTQALNLNTEFARAYESRAGVYEKLGQYEQAIADYSTFLNLKPDSVNAYLQRAQAYEQTGNLNAAISDYTQALALQPDASAYYNRGQLYQAIQQYDQALQDYNQAIQQDPNYAQAYFARGSIAYQNGQYDDAVLDLTKAISLGYGNPDVYVFRGIAYLQKQQGPPAIEDFTQALSLAPERIDLYFYRAQAYVLTENTKAAIDDLTQFLNLAAADSPLRIEAKQLLERLQSGEPVKDTGTPIIAPTLPINPINPVNPNK